MADVRPFRALRPEAKLAAQICELPYDVMSSEEARALAKDNPLSFLHVSKPEIDLPSEVDIYDAQVYAKGKENFEKLISQGALKQDERPSFYLYRQVMGEHSQTGFVAVASCEDYLKEIVKKHEFTRPDKEDDRVRHIETLNSQTGPVFLTYRATEALDKILAEESVKAPAVDFTAADGVQHTAWRITDEMLNSVISEEFRKIPALYIADGHHRSAAAARVYKSRNGAGGSGHFLSVIFPHTQLAIMPYNRVLKDLNGLSPKQLIEKLDSLFVIKSPGEAKPKRRHEIGLYLEGGWHSLFFRPQFVDTKDAFEKLDVALLQRFVLAPIFGIDDPRTSKRIAFVGGIRGTAELEKMVDKGDYACAFSMYPTSIEELITIADAGGIMPPKSTWFEPKLRDAMFCHLI